MKKITFLGLLLLPLTAFSQASKSFTEKLDAISTTKKELTKNASTDNSSIGQAGAMTNSVPLITVSSRTMTFPLQLSYAAGIKVNQQSGPVGLGWALPVGSIKRDFGAYYPDYSSTAHEADMFNVLDENLTGNPNKGKFNTRIGEGAQAVHGTYMDPAMHQKYLGFDAIANDQTRSMPLSDMYHISVPGKLSNSFFNGGGINQAHAWKLTEIENWKIAHTVTNYKVPQEFSRINEVNLVRTANDNMDLSSSYASAIGVLPYVENGYAKAALTNTSFNPAEQERYVRYDDFEQFVITDDNGTRYVFGRALRGQRYVFNDDPYWSNSPGYDEFLGDKGSFWKIDYIAEWLLTEIQSVDYVDSNGNGIADDGDAGDWIRFEYTDATKSEATYLGGSCFWYEHPVPKYREWSHFSQTDRASSLMRELAYLKKIVTPTQEIDFTISERYDVEHDYFTKPANRVGNDYYYENRKLCPENGSTSDFDIHYPVETMRYDSIKVKSRLVDPKLYPNENLQSGLIKFNYAAKGSSRELAVSSFLIRNNNKQEKTVGGTLVGAPSRGGNFTIADYADNGVNKRGKTTLLGIEFYGANVVSTEKSEYTFEYAYNPGYDEFHKRDIIRAYHFPSLRQGSSLNNQVIPFSKASSSIVTYPEIVFNSSGDFSIQNRSGISPYDFLIDFPYQEVDYKLNASVSEIFAYANNNDTTLMGYSLAATNNYHGVNPIQDVFGYFYIPGYATASSAWSLTKITYPTGGEVSFQYEPASFTESAEWSIKGDNFPIVARYNEVAKRRSYIQDAHNQRYATSYYPHTLLYPKKLTSTFEVALPLQYGIRLKEKTTNDKINPVVKLTYEYENGTFTSLPAEFIQNVLSGFNSFVSRENRKHSLELQKYHLDPMIAGQWDYDYAQKMSELSHTNIALDDYSAVFFYKKIRTKYADNSYIEKVYGSTFTADIEFPQYNVYCYIMKGASSWQGSYTLAGNNLLKSPVSLKSEAYFEPNTSTPYKKTTYTYERTFPAAHWLKFDYNGSQSGMGSVVLWNAGFNYYKPRTSLTAPYVTLYDFVHENPDTPLETTSYCTIGEAGNTTEGNSNSYVKWISLKTYLKTETTDYKGIISAVDYTYEQTTGTDQKIVLRQTKKQTIGEPLSYITRNVYAFEIYGSATDKFRNRNLISLPYRTTTYLNSVLASNTLSDQVMTYDLSPDVPKVLDTYSYETTAIDPLTGTFTPTTFSTSDPKWRISETDIYEYNPAAMPVSARSNQLFTKAVTGNRMNTVKATVIGTERPFDATYTGFEDFTQLNLISEWDNLRYLKEDWFTTETYSIDIPAVIQSINNLDVCDPAHTSSTPGDGGQTLYYRVSVNDISNLHPEDQVTLTYTTVANGIIHTSELQIEDIQPKSVSNYPRTGDLDYFVCFTAAPVVTSTPTTYTNAKITVQRVLSRLTDRYARTGKYSYQLATIRANGADPKKTPVRPVRIAPLTSASECNIAEGPGDGGVQGRNPNIPASCYWDYTASLWIKYDSDIPVNPAPTIPSASFSDDAAADAIYRRGEVSTLTVTGVRIKCKIWNNSKTIVTDEFTFYPQELNGAWKQYTIDFSVFKGPEQWVEVYVENTVSQIGASSLQYRSAFVDDILIAPKESRYEYNVTNALGQQTFQVNNNDVFVQSTFDSKGRVSTARNAYGKITQELSYFDQANWTASHNYVTQINWVGNGLFNTTRYFMDGFGRTKQVQSSDHIRNMRAISETTLYNDKGQAVKAYKPYYIDKYGLDPKYDVSFAAKTQALYGSNYGFTEVTFEPKPEDVVSTVSAPRSNTESAVTSSQTEYINTTPLSHMSTSGTTNFPVGTLLVHEMVNPNGKITRTYLNRLGQVILEEHQIGMDHVQNTDGSISFTGTDLGFAQTWFYYDGAGRIVATYDPENKKSSYFYNSLGVMVRTISPDKGTSELRYDRYGQVRFTRNQKDIDAATGNSYGTSQFRYTKYDKWGQTIENGVVTVAPNNLGVSVSPPPFPVDVFNDYAKINDPAFPKNTDKFVQVHAKNVYGGTRKFYSSAAVTEQYTYSGHVLNTSTFTYSPAKTDQISVTYMADGQPAKTSYGYDGLPGTHQVVAVYNEMSLPVGKSYVHPTDPAVNFQWNSTVDNYGRLLTASNTYNNLATQVLRNYYDPMGNLLLAGLGATGVGSNPYTDYVSIKKNIREQLVSQMSKYYRVGLTYDKAGNITNQYWSNEQFDPATASSTGINQYAYTYDKMNRLIGADYKRSTLTSNPFQYYSTLNANIPNDFVCSIDGNVVQLVFNPVYTRLQKNITDGVQPVQAQKSIDALNLLQSDYVKNNVQYQEMSTAQVDEFFAQYIAKAAKNSIAPLEYEYYEAARANDNAHITYLNGLNRIVPIGALKYMRILLNTIPITPPVNCMPNPGATAYGYLQNFPAPTAASNSQKYDAAYWYQKNGNFQKLHRNDDTDAPTPNRTQQLYSYQPGTNRLTQATFQVNTGSITPYNYTYDPNGNLLTDPKNQQMQFAYSLFHELPVQMTNGNGQHSYRYFNGARSVKEISTTDREYYVDGIILDQNGAVKSYQTATGYAVPNGAAATYFYQVKDWLGSLRVTVDTTATIRNAMDYYPYGKPMPGRGYFNTSHEGYRYQYTGHEKDGETNYQYHGARYYEEDLARYLSVDPWADKYPGWSTYNYVMSNPNRFIDPTGMGAEDIIIRNVYKDNKGKEQSFNVKYKDGKVYDMSNKEYTPNKGGYIETVVNQLNILKTDGDRPKTVVETLENGSGQHIITNGTEAERSDAGAGNANGSVPSDPKSSVTIYDAFGEYRNNIKEIDNKRDPRVGLIHELTHAYDRQTGADWKFNYDVYHTYGSEPLLSLGEVHAVVIENIVRQKTGDPQRTQYGGVEIPEGYLKQKK